MLQQRNMMAPETIAMRYVNAEKGVETAEDALQGAMDIIAEVVSDDAAVRTKLKTYYHQTAMVATAAAKDEDSTYRMYYDHRESLRLMPSHRVLAMNRGVSARSRATGRSSAVAIWLLQDRNITSLTIGWIIASSPPRRQFSRCFFRALHHARSSAGRFGSPAR